MGRYVIPAGAFALVCGLALPQGEALSQPRPPARTQVGTLTCNVSGGLGLIITSRKTMVCAFRTRGGVETYTGEIRRFGLDIGATSGGQLVWSVLARSRVPRGALAGEYAGGSAEATVGGGIGANVLVGGSRRSVALQPVSITGQTGVNLAVGVAGLRLRARS
jgi:hypothetical protein